MAVDRLASLALRCATLFGKSILVFVLARYLEPTQVGLYGLLGATISYALYMVGLDFYTYSTREIIKHDKAVWGRLLKSQAALSAWMYLVVAPIVLIVFACGLLPWQLLGWMVVLLPLEHLNQELTRLLIALSRPVLAGWVMFLRSGFWPLMLAVLFIGVPELRSLDTALALWVGSSIAAWCLGILTVRHMGTSGWREAVDWAWVRQGVKIASVLLLGTLALRGVLTLDRYWLEALQGLDVVAAYVVFIAVAGVLSAFLDSAVFNFQYPALILHWSQGNPAEFRRGTMNMLVQSILVAAAYCTVALLLIDVLLVWLQNDLYVRYVDLFPWLLAAMTLYSLSMIPHYALYAAKSDRVIATSHLGALIAFVLVTAATSTASSEWAVVVGLNAAFSWMLVHKTWYYMRHIPDEYRLSGGNGS